MRANDTIMIPFMNRIWDSSLRLGVTRGKLYLVDNLLPDHVGLPHVLDLNVNLVLVNLDG